MHVELAAVAAAFASTLAAAAPAAAAPVDDEPFARIDDEYGVTVRDLKITRRAG